MVLGVAVAFGALGLATLAQLAGATHPRPKGATPVRVSLVPSYNECTTPNRQHGPPLSFPSCHPPVQSSNFVTVGAPDANGAPANSVGFVRLHVIVGAPGPPDDSEIALTASITDVRCKAGTTACGNANAHEGPDYTGELEGNATIRVTDHNNAVDPGGGNDPATVIDIESPFSLLCANTTDTNIGGNCTLTTASCLGCLGTIKDGKRTVVEVTQLRLFDGGADGLINTTPNTQFAEQGIFIP